MFDKSDTASYYNGKLMMRSSNSSGMNDRVAGDDTSKYSVPSIEQIYTNNSQ